MPEAWWVMVPGENFEFGEGLSLLGEENVRTAIHHIETLIEKVTPQSRVRCIRE